MSAVDLLPCPFCGEKPAVQYGFGRARVICSGCDASKGWLKQVMDCPTPLAERAIAAWNTRAHPAPAIEAKPVDGAPPCWWIDHGLYGQVTLRQDEASAAVAEGKRVVCYRADLAGAESLRGEVDAYASTAHCEIHRANDMQHRAEKAEAERDAALARVAGVTDLAAYLLQGDPDPNTVGMLLSRAGLEPAEVNYMPANALTPQPDAGLEALEPRLAHIERMISMFYLRTDHAEAMETMRLVRTALRRPVGEVRPLVWKAVLGSNSRAYAVGLCYEVAMREATGEWFWWLQHLPHRKSDAFPSEAAARAAAQVDFARRIEAEIIRAALTEGDAG